MRSYHRKTLIAKENWPLIDGWYWCPIPTIEKRIEDEKERIDGFRHHSAISYSFARWREIQDNLDARLAHACKDGKIRAPWHIEYYTQKGGAVSIYGKCRHCDEVLSEGIKTIIIMETEM
jgi:hypothetical protein